jgi:hypothetical protein
MVTLFKDFASKVDLIEVFGNALPCDAMDRTADGFATTADCILFPAMLCGCDGCDFGILPARLPSADCGAPLANPVGLNSEELSLPSSASSKPMGLFVESFDLMSSGIWDIIASAVPAFMASCGFSIRSFSDLALAFITAAVVMARCPGSCIFNSLSFKSGRASISKPFAKLRALAVRPPESDDPSDPCFGIFSFFELG